MVPVILAGRAISSQNLAFGLTSHTVTAFKHLIILAHKDAVTPLK